MGLGRRTRSMWTGRTRMCRLVEEDETYTLECHLCETETEVLVKDCEEEPQYCPMCGVANN